MQNNEQRTQRILEHLEQQLRRPHEPSHENFQRIIEVVLNIPDAYKSTGLTTVAEHFVNGMEMHLLELVALFKENAELEGISREEFQATLQDVLPEAFQTLAILRKQIRITTLDELAALNNITIKLYTLSRSDTAIEAQQWLYEVPATYVRQLRQARLLKEEQSIDKRVPDEEKGSSSHFTKWSPSYTSNLSKSKQGIGNTTIEYSTPSISSSEPIPTPVEVNSSDLFSAA